MKGFLRAFSLTALVVSPLVFAEDEQRDFYAEPGVNPFKTAAGQDVTENIDPFSGNIQLSYVDMTIPGNGGLDINITRVYNLPQNIPSYNNPYGYGWTMHFGRITIGSGSVTQLCGTGAIGGGDTQDNPSIEMPDGGREILVHSSALADGTFISKSNWIASCIDPNDYTQGVEVTAPNGTVYLMQERAFVQGEDGAQGEAAPFVETWFTNQIIDAYDNTIDISYLTIANGMKLISQMDASDGRQVLFSYLDENDQDVSAVSNSARLSEITANSQTWQYLYNPINEVSTGWGGIQHYTLDQVVRPDGTSWNYDYGLVNANPDYNRITKVTYPFGGEVNYTYQKFKPYSPNDAFEIVAIDSKTQTNPGHASGTWSYNFQPGTVLFQDLGWDQPENIGRQADLTTITTPTGVEHVYHAGYWAMVGRLNVLYQMGLKLRHDILSVDPGDGSLTIVKSIRNSWGFRSISNEEYRQGILSSLWDDQVYVPVLLSEFVSTGGFGTRVDYDNHDAFGNPGTITEYSVFAGIGDKVTTQTYVNDTVNWFIGLPDIETVSQDSITVGVIDRDYNNLGRLETEDRFGVVTQYSYTLEGDLNQVTDARNFTTTYSNYFRGTPQLEQYPDNTQISRVINPTGTVASETSGRGHTTSFMYDDLNRLTGIDYPVGTDVTIDWFSNSKMLTRGNYEETVEWDGFGRDIKVTRKDRVLGFTYEKIFEYDEFGRKTFESDPNSTDGITWEYDLLNRITKVTNQDDTFKRIVYDGSYRELHYDENNHETDYRYLIFGKAENKYLKDIASPEGVGTFIDRDVFGKITSVFQGEVDPSDPTHYTGYTKSYGYDSRHYLTTLSSPADIGLTTYGRDPLGNMDSKQVGASNTIVYQYDPMNRLETVDYQDDSIDVSHSYDADGNLKSITNSYGIRGYDYDNNGNLITENITIGTSNYQVQYLPDGLDNVQQVTYPSGRTINYAPDALGRPTQALPYLTNVGYFPDGSVQQMDYANGQSTTFTRTARKWIDTISVAGSSIVASLDYNYDDTGNIDGIVDILDADKNRTMTYDGLNRLKTVNGSWGSSNFSYDAWSNIKQKTDPTQGNRTQTYEYLGLMLDKISYSGTPEKRGFSYDDFGNITYSDDVIYDILTGLPIETFTTRQNFYDDTGNMTYTQRIAEDSSGNAVPLRSGRFSSEYDGKNNRIRKINHYDNEKETEYVYSEAGLLLGEYDLAGNLYGQESFYLGTQQIATAKTNAPPQVDAGPDQQTYGGLTVNLSGSDSDVDGAVVSRLWSQLSGPEITINNTTSQSINFTAPELSTNEVVVLDYSVTDDRGKVSTDTVTVSVTSNHPPVADAGPDQQVLYGEIVQLDGSNSSDVEGPITYQWSGKNIDDPTSPTPTTYYAESTSSYSYHTSWTYTLTVTDAAGVTAQDTVRISFYSNNLDEDADGLGDGWEFRSFGDISLYDGESDPDGDGVKNRQEYLEGTSPTLAEMPSEIPVLGAVPGDGKIALTWDKALSATAYKIYWASDLSTPFESWSIEESSTNYFVHDGLANGQEYYYRIAPFNNLGVQNPSSTVSGVPDVQTWQASKRVPDGLATFDLANTVVVSNDLGDAVVIYEENDGLTYSLFAQRFTVVAGWEGQELISQSSEPHLGVKGALSNNRAGLIIWRQTDGERHHLWSSYYSLELGWGSPELVENYDGSYKSDGFENDDGDVLSTEYLGFSDEGVAMACWRQHKTLYYKVSSIHFVYYQNNEASQTSFFYPGEGWRKPVAVEDDERQIGDVHNMSCEISQDGNAFVAVEKDADYGPCYGCTGIWADEIFVRPYDRVTGWRQLDTVDRLMDGIPDETSGNDIENFYPSVALSFGGGAIVAWREGVSDGIHSLIYHFDTDSWDSLVTHENRSSQIPIGVHPKARMNAAGDVLVSWAGDYQTKLTEEQNWGRSYPLLSGVDAIQLDSQGFPIVAGTTSTTIFSAKGEGRSWTTEELVSSSGELLSLQDMAVDVVDNVIVYWGIGDELRVSEKIPTDAPVPGNTPPVADAGPDQSVLEGAFVQLDGNSSFDPDGIISSYRWQQVSGTLVTLNNIDTAAADFNAPFVTANEELIFQLTVTDDLGDTDSDSVNVTVQYNGPDTTPPVTNFSTQEQTVKGAPKHTVTLTVNESATTYFRFIGQGTITGGGIDTTDWQIYTEPVVVELVKKGSGDFEFYSEDIAGNVEATQLEVLQ